MRETFIKAALTAGLFGLATTAVAQSSGPRLKGSVNQSFEINDNSNLSGSGLSFRSLTGVSFGLSSRTATSSISATSGISLSADKNGFSLSRPQLNLSFGTNTKDVNYSGSLSFSRAPVSVGEVQPDLSVLRVDADRTSINGSLGATTKLDPSTSLSFGVNAGRTDFDPSSATLVASSTFGVNAGISYQLNQRTSYGFNGRLGWFEADNVSNTTSLSADVGANLSHQLTTDKAFDANLGLSFIDTTNTVSGVEASAFSVSLLFGAGLTQKLPDGSIGVSLSQSVNPSASGSLALGTTLNGNYAKTVNANESYGIGASLGRQENIGGGPVTTFLNISPRYSRQLTRDVAATARYYVQRDDTGDMAQGLTVSFSRPFDWPLR